MTYLNARCKFFLLLGLLAGPYVQAADLAIKNDSITEPVLSNSKAILEEVIPTYFECFTAEKLGEAVRLKWFTKREVHVAGYEVERFTATGVWQRIAYVRSHGSYDRKGIYLFTDQYPTVGPNQYRLKLLHPDGQITFTEKLCLILPDRKRKEISR